MAFIDLLRQLLQNETASAREEDVARGVELREILNENPNDISSFQELAELVHSAGTSRSVEDPLTADIAEADHGDAELAMWSLAEELSAKPTAWYPLIELARLSIGSDQEGGTRRLTTAVQRDDSGVALSEAIRVLREAEQPETGMSLGIGHWDPSQQDFVAGEQIVLAALEAKRCDMARTYLETLSEHSDDTERLDFLSALVDKAENEDN